MHQQTVGIVGGGIAGLTAAYRLYKKGVAFQLFEADDRTGGKIRTERSGGYLLEHGPNSLQTTSAVAERLIDELGLSDRRVFAHAAARNRYVVRRGKLTPLPMSPPALLTSGLFSLRAKLRALREPLVKKAASLQDESVAAFVRRRLGHEILDYAIDPFVTGIFAGDPETLSLQHAFPALYDLEQQHGSLIKGLIANRPPKNGSVAESKRRIYSFGEGLQTLPDALANTLQEQIQTGARVLRADHGTSGWKIEVEHAGEQKSHTFDALLWTIPLPGLRAIGLDVEPSLEPLYEIVYPPVTVLALGFHRDEVSHPLDGFGLLVPSKESSTRILGALFSSSVFPNRAPEEHVLLTALIGGARKAELTDLPDDLLLDLTIDDLHALLGVHGEPTFVRRIDWPHAIPQYNLGYEKAKTTLETIEKRHPGLYFAGNYRQGISVGDAMQSGEDAADRMAAFVSGRETAWRGSST